MMTNSSILVVDDEKIVRESLTKWFREDGYQVAGAEDAAAALKQMQAKPESQTAQAKKEMSKLC